MYSYFTELTEKTDQMNESMNMSINMGENASPDKVQKSGSVQQPIIMADLEAKPAHSAREMNNSNTAELSARAAVLQADSGVRRNTPGFSDELSKGAAANEPDSGARRDTPPFEEDLSARTIEKDAVKDDVKNGAKEKD